MLFAYKYTHLGLDCRLHFRSSGLLNFFRSDPIYTYAQVQCYIVEVFYLKPFCDNTEDQSHLSADCAIELEPTCN